MGQVGAFLGQLTAVEKEVVGVLLALFVVVRAVYRAWGSTMEAVVYYNGDCW